MSTTSTLVPVLISAVCGAAVSTAAWAFAGGARNPATRDGASTAPLLTPEDAVARRGSESAAAPRRRSSAGSDGSGGKKKKKKGEAEGDEDDEDAGKTESQNLLNLLYSIAEDQARKEGYIHRGITCNHCGMSPIRGTRFKCSNCVDFDVCENCEAQDVHQKSHVFLKIRIPIPPLANPRTALLNPFYPGARAAPGTAAEEILPYDKLRELQHATHFDQLEIEALYEQFKALATDPRGISRAVYEQSLGPLGLEKNLITERIFKFFDRDDDAYIGFPELVAGLSVLTKGSIDEKITCAFRGYDLDGDGKITKAELHAMFKAYFHLSMELVRDVVKAMEEEMMASFDDDNNKPVSAAFTAPIPASAVGNNNANNGNRNAGEDGDAAADGSSSTGPGGRPWQKGDDPDAHRRPASSSAASSSRTPALQEHPAESGFVSGGDDSVPATPIHASFVTAASPSSAHPAHNHGYGHASIPATLAAASSAVARGRGAGPGGRLMSVDIDAHHAALVAARNNAAAASAAAAAASSGNPDRLQPIMEQMSQDALVEMVATVFHNIDVEEKGYIEFDEFKAYVENDPTLISWFETLGSVF
ncbi:hypothetical protein H9P43_009444 [Blastocladiella emersonii ATCC 22665]|nr:hypothetical protein H9P43_009444 [Blastocladiella emersonii ATCC 22665]